MTLRPYRAPGTASKLQTSCQTSTLSSINQGLSWLSRTPTPVMQKRIHIERRKPTWNNLVEVGVSRFRAALLQYTCIKTEFQTTNAFVSNSIASAKVVQPGELDLTNDLHEKEPKNLRMMHHDVHGSQSHQILKTLAIHLPPCTK